MNKKSCRWLESRYSPVFSQISRLWKGMKYAHDIRVIGVEKDWSNRAR